VIDVEIAPESMAEIEELRRRMHNAALQLVHTGNTAVDRMVAYAITNLGERWEADAPRLTGTLAAATRERIIDETGKVFIDPTVTNPVFGGNPVEYGPAVHSRKPWVGRIMVSDAPGILTKAGVEFFAEIAEIFNQ
jgi:hypothetical protein